MTELHLLPPTEAAPASVAPVVAPAPSAPIAPTVAPTVPAFQATQQETRAFAQQLRQQTLAVRVRHEKFGVRKALTKGQITTAAAEFDADAHFLGASKKLIDTRHPKYKAVVNVRTRATDYWRFSSTPYPEPGTRLIRKDKVTEFTTKMTGLRQELRAAAESLQEAYAELREAARDKLGDLFDGSDYPARIDTEFDLDWDFPSIEPPQYLKDLHPHLYEQEQARIAARFEEAVRLTEVAFAEQFRKLVAHLAERLRGDADGKPKVFRDSAVANLTEFFDAFRQMSVGGSQELQRLVDQAQQVVKGLSPDDLRNQDNLRANVVAELTAVEQALDGLMVSKPKRAISLEE